MLNRILDNYYTKKLLEELKWCFKVRGLDYKFKNEKHRVLIEAKPKKYSNKFYSAIIKIEKNEALKYLCDLDKFKVDVRKIVDEYSKDIVERS